MKCSGIGAQGGVLRRVAGGLLAGAAVFGCISSTVWAQPAPAQAPAWIAPSEAMIQGRSSQGSTPARHPSYPQGTTAQQQYTPQSQYGQPHGQQYQTAPQYPAGQQYPARPGSQFPAQPPRQGMAPQSAPVTTAGWMAPADARGGHIAPANFASQDGMLPTGAIRQVQNSAESARTLHRLIESMPTEQEELELIERRSQLMNTKSNVTRIHIVDPAIVDVVQYGPRELAFLGLARGSTTMMLWFDGETEPVIYLVKTIRDPSLDNQRRVDYGKLEKKINTLFPNSKVYLIPMSWKIIVRGQARDQQEAANILQIIQGEVLAQDGSLWGPNAGVGAGVDAGGFGSGFNTLYGTGLGFNQFQSGLIINELQVPGEFQIALRVRIAELNRSQARTMGIDFNVLFNNATQNIFTNLGAAGAATLGGIFESGDVQIFLQWLAANGTAKILTEPNVTVISGREARFLAGGEFAVPTIVGIGGAQGQTTSFRGFGTSLLVTPSIIDRDLIRIRTIAEYSDLNQANAVGGIPGTDARRVETTVEMREGQTLALAGLLSHRTVTTVTRIPFLGDIPKVGPLLFSTKQSTQEENELLILITPEIVRPMDAHEVPPVPGFEVTVPQDVELYKHNMTEGSPDTGYYQLPPYGSGSVGTNVGYQHFNPGPANSMYSPQPTNPYGSGFSSPSPNQNGMPTGPGTAYPPDSLPPIPPAMGPGMNYGPGSQSPTLRQVPPAPAGQPTAQYGAWSGPANSTQTIQPSNYTAPRSAPAGQMPPGSRNPARPVR